MRSCVHWNYGYYGPEKKCMIGKVCKCEDYERRGTAKRRRARHRTIQASKERGSVPLGISKGFKKSDHCLYQLIETVDGVQIITCAYGSKLKVLPRSCPKNCPYQEPPGRQ